MARVKRGTKRRARRKKYLKRTKGFFLTKSKLYQSAQEAVNRAQRAYDISIAQLRAGTVNLLTVLNTENALFPAQDALVQSRLARMQAAAGLFKALGGGWQ